MRRALSYVEIDVPSYVENSPPDPDTTFRFAVDTSYLPREIDAIPSIRDDKDISLQPGIISLGENLGQRATLTIKFTDHRHVFAGEPFNSGTFWGKFRARYGLKLRGRNIRLIRGYLGQTLAEMETRHYLIESSDGPNPKGEYKLVAKDVLKLADGDRALAPLPSNGFLVAGISAVAGSFTLSPSGIGSEYAAAGTAAIGGKEIVGYTRAGDVFTIARAVFNTVAQAHDAGDRVQYCYRADGATVSALIKDLLTTHAGVPPTYIPIAAWEAEEAAFLGTLYSVLIAEPTSVSKLLSELIQQAALALWWDDLTQQIRMQVLRAISTGAGDFTPENYIDDSLDVREQPEKRLSQVITYFGKINPLVSDDEADNYRSMAVQTDDTAADEYGSQVTKIIKSRWIPAGGRTVADRVNEVQLARYRDPPRRFNFDVMRYSGTVPILGGGYQLEGQPFQDTLGASVQIPMQITRLNPGAAVIEAEAEEMLFQAGTELDPTEHPLIFDSNVNNVNLRTSHDAIYPAPISGDTITATINAGVIIGSATTSGRAFEVGSWPAGVTVNVIVNGRIQGAGGAGGAKVGPTKNPGLSGGAALYTRFAINLTSTSGQLWSGAGGGGAEDDGSGGGGAGQLPGAGGAGSVPGAPGTTEAGGVGGNGQGGDGGGPGLAGETTADAAGGAAGAAIDGDSFVTDIGGVGDIRGAQIN
jgi:hypothetical protein